MPPCAISSRVRAHLDDRPVLHHADEVRVLHRRQPVSDDERRAVLREAGQRAPAPAAPIPCRARWLPRRAAGLARPSGLRARARGAGAGRPTAACRDHRSRCRSPGAARDELVRRRRLRRGNDLRLGAPSRPRAMLAPIVSSNSVTSWLTIEIAPRSDASVTSRTSWPSIRMRPAGHVEQPRHEIDDRRLAGARTADERHGARRPAPPARSSRTAGAPPVRHRRRTTSSKLDSAALDRERLARPAGRRCVASRRAMP